MRGALRGVITSAANCKPAAHLCDRDASHKVRLSRREDAPVTPRRDRIEQFQLHPHTADIQ